MIACCFGGLLFSKFGAKHTLFSTLMLASVAGMVIAVGGRDL